MLRRAGLERFDKRPQKGSYTFASAQQFDQSHHSKQAEKIDGDDGGAGINLRVNDVDETSEDYDKVENIPSVPEIVLESKGRQFKDKLESEDRGEYHI